MEWRSCRAVVVNVVATVVVAGVGIRVGVVGDVGLVAAGKC